VHGHKIRKALATKTTTIMEREIGQTTVKSKLDDILLMVTWGKIARQYFGKPSSWIHDKLNGRGEGGEFTEEEADRLRDALIDFSDRVRRCAELL